MRTILRAITLVSYLLFSQASSAKELVSSFDFGQPESFGRYATGNEYIAGQEPGVVMMKVNLWGAVRKPGIHHIPVKTSLVSLMSYAGGPSDNAIMESITVKRNQGQKQTKVTVNLEEIIHGGGDRPYDLTLQPEDIIVVPSKEPLVSQNTFMVAIFASTIASIVLSAVLIHENTKD